MTEQRRSTTEGESAEESRKVASSRGTGETSHGAALPEAARAGQPDAAYNVPLDLLPDAVVIADANGRIVTANRQFEAMFGHSAANAPGMPIELLMPERFRGRHLVTAQQFRDCPRARQMGSGLELFALRADGAEFPVEIALAPLDVPSGLMTLASIRDISDRKRADQRLRDSERRYRELVENSPDTVFQLDTRLRFSYLSAGILALLGYEREELIGQSIERVLTNEAMEVVRGVVAEREASERRGIKTDISSYELDCVRKDGGIVPVEVRSRPNRDDGGLIDGLLCVARDIADRRRTEEYLRESRAHLALAQRVGRIGSVQLDLLTGRDIWSDEMYRLLGLDPAKTMLSVDTILSLTHPDDRDALRRLYDLAQGGVEAEPFEVRVNPPAGGMRWFLRTPMLVRDAGGTPRTHFVTYQDITERKSLEAALRAQTAELHAVREHLERAQAVGHIGSAEVDLATLKQRWSDEYYRLIGLAPKSVPPGSKLFRSKVLPEDAGKLRPLSAFSSIREPIAPVEFRVRHDSGDIRWLHSEAAIVSDESGKPARLILTMRDVTEQKLAENERSFLQHQLFQAQKLDALGKLAGGVAHDFNNLLAVILGRLEMIVEDLADRPTVQDWVRSAVKAARRGTSLTKMMLTFARAQPLQKQDIEPSALVREMMDMLGRLLGETITVRVTTAPEPWSCEADPGQLQNALINLAVNARDAMPKGGILTIETSNVSLKAAEAAKFVGAKPGDYVAISVSDTGSGMPPEVLTRAFEPFFTTKDPDKGTGLGLSMVNGFVRQLGGFVTLESKEARGTKVRIHLPRKIARQDEARPEETRRKLPSRAESILILEDNDELRDLLLHQVKGLGYRVNGAANAAEALALLRDDPDIALLLSDIVLPGGTDGVEAARSAVEIRPNLKVIFMTGHTDHTELPALGRSGAARLLRKPFANQDLAEAIRHALDGS